MEMLRAPCVPDDEWSHRPAEKGVEDEARPEVRMAAGVWRNTPR